MDFYVAVKNSRNHHVNAGDLFWCIGTNLQICYPKHKTQEQFWEMRKYQMQFIGIERQEIHSYWPSVGMSKVFMKVQIHPENHKIYREQLLKLLPTEKLPHKDYSPLDYFKEVYLNPF